MNFEHFKSITIGRVNHYLKQIDNLAKTGGILPRYGQIYFPTHAVFYKDSTGNFAVELIGLTKDLVELKIVQKDTRDINALVNGFDSTGLNPLFSVEGSFQGNMLKNLAIVPDQGFEFISKRFEGLDKNFKSIMSFGGTLKCPVAFKKNFSGSFFISNCFFGYEKHNFYRGRYIQFAIICNKKTDISTFEFYLNTILATTNGSKMEIAFRRNFDSEAIEMQLIELIGILLNETIGEIDITSYFRNCSEFLKKSLEAKSIHFECTFTDSRSTDSYRADIIVELPNGNGRIIEFKKALLDKKSLVRGSARRLRFIDAVNEAIAQSSKYKEVLSQKTNLNDFNKKYGTSIRDFEIEIVIGNADIYDLDEIEAALLPYKYITITNNEFFVNLHWNKMRYRTNIIYL